MASLVLSKPVGKKYLNLELDMSEEKPRVLIYFLRLSNKMGGWGSSNTEEDEMFLPPHYSELLNMPLYRLIYDAIETEDDFRRLKVDLGDKIKALYESVVCIDIDL